MSNARLWVTLLERSQVLQVVYQPLLQILGKCLLA